MIVRAKPFKYQEEHLNFIRKKTEDETWKVFAEKFNKNFGTRLSHLAIQRMALRNGVRKSYSCKGKSSWNKGMKGVDCAGENGRKTQFKKGHKPLNSKPIGSERNLGDYVLVKVAEPNEWQLKHYLIWEEAYGPIPDNHIILFLDGNKKNLSLDNLQLILRSQLGQMNLHGLISDNPEITKSGILIASIYSKIGEIKKGVK